MHHSYVPVLKAADKFLARPVGNDAAVQAFLPVALSCRGILRANVVDYASGISSSAGANDDLQDFPPIQALIVDVPVSTIIGFGKSERSSRQPLRIQVWTTAAAVDTFPDATVSAVTDAVRRTATRSDSQTIERRAAEVLRTVFDTLPLAQWARVVVEKPAIGRLTGHNMLFASFSHARRRENVVVDVDSVPADPAITATARNLGTAAAPMSEAVKATVQGRAGADDVDAAANMVTLRKWSDEYVSVASAIDDLVAPGGLCSDRALRVLDIGAGNGVLHLCSSLHRKSTGDPVCGTTDEADDGSITEGNGRIASLSVVEPNQHMHARLRESAAAVCAADAVELVSRPFTASTHLDGAGSFDMVLFVHSLYNASSAAGDGAGALALVANATRHLRPGGVLLIAHRATSFFKFAHGLPALLDISSVVHHDCSITNVTNDNEVMTAVLSTMTGVDVQLLDQADRATLRRQWVRADGTIDATMTITIGTAPLLVIDSSIKVLEDRIDAVNIRRRNDDDNAPDALHSCGINIRAGALSVVVVRGSQEYQDARSRIKNKSSRLEAPAAIIYPTSVAAVQTVVRWAHDFGAHVSVVGGGHSDHCLITPRAGDLIVAISLHHMAAVSIDASAATVTAGGGATINDIAAAAAVEGLFVPLGSRPSVGMGLALHGGIGHWSRTHGLACDSILAVTMVTPDGMVVNVNDGSHPELMSAVRGAGSSFGCIVAIIFRAYPFSPLHVTTMRAAAHAGTVEESLLRYFHKSAALPPTTALDMYICPAAGAGGGNAERSSASDGSPVVLLQQFCQELDGATAASSKITAHGGTQMDDWCEPVPGLHASTIATFSDVYEAELHRILPKAARDFKRTVLVPAAAAERVTHVLRRAMESAPTPLCYVHSVHVGGGAAASSAAPAAIRTAFGNDRDWEWAFVVTGRATATTKVGPRLLADITNWVYDVVRRLLDTHACSAAYPADLGAGVRDVLLARTSFGSNAAALARLQQGTDPTGMFSLGMPLQTIRVEAADVRPASSCVRVVVAVCGRRFVGKDHVANELRKILERAGLRIRVASISDPFKAQYAKSVGVNVQELLHARSVKEFHRADMTTAWEAHVAARGDLCNARSFTDVLADADRCGSVDVLIVTGMREGVDVAANVRSAHRPTWRMLVDANDAARASRGWIHDDSVDRSHSEAALDAVEHWDIEVSNDGVPETCTGTNGTAELRLRGDLDSTVAWVHLHADWAHAATEKEAGHPSPLLAERVAAAARSIPDFPLPGVLFCDVLAVAHNPALYGDVTQWIANEVARLCPTARAIVTIESSGAVFAAPAARIASLPLVVVRKRASGGLPREPRPAAATEHTGSNVTRNTTTMELRIGMSELREGADVVLVDDVLSTGATSRSVVDLLQRDFGVRVVGAVYVLKFAGHSGADNFGQQPLGSVRVSAICNLAGR